MSSALDPARFAALCEIPLSQAADHEKLPGWNDVPDSEKDSPSTGNNGSGQSPVVACKQPEGSPSSKASEANTAEVEKAREHPGQPIPADANALEASMELSPLPDSPTGLAAPISFHDEEHPSANDQALSSQGWANDALPITQAPDIEIASPDISATEDDMAAMEDSPAEKEGQPSMHQDDQLPADASPAATIKGAGADGSAEPQTVLGTISRVVLKPLGFGRFATGMFTRRASAATKPGAATPEAQGLPASPALAQAEGDLNSGSPSTIQARLLSRLQPSPRADAIKQGLQLIEQAHQLGPDALQLHTQEPPVAGMETNVPEVVMGRGDSAVAEAISQAVQTPRDVAAAVVAVQLDGAIAKASLPPTLEGTELGASIAQESIAVAQAAVQQAAAGTYPPMKGPSRKRSAEDVDAGEESGRDALPRRRRRLRTGMEVVWKFFGVSKPDN